MSVRGTQALIPLERSRTLTEDVYQRIRAAIVQRTFGPGERLTELALAELLGVSKTPVREALLRLREVGLVRPDGRRGVRVVELSPAVLDDAYEVREALELTAIGKAAATSDPDQLEPLERAAANAMAGAEQGDVEEFSRWDGVFHLELARLSGNAQLLKLLRDTLDLIAAIRQGQAEHRDASTACASAHFGIIEALRERDADQSAERLRRHIREGWDRYAVEPPMPEFDAGR